MSIGSDNGRGIGRLVIVGCSRRKQPTEVALPALQLYQGGVVVRLNAVVGHDPALRARVRILSAEHGVVAADTPLLPYDRRLDLARARQLRPRVGRALLAQIDRDHVGEVLVVVEPTYLVLVADLLARGDLRVRWFPDPARDWPAAVAVLAEWGWL